MPAIQKIKLGHMIPFSTADLPTVGSSIGCERDKNQLHSTFDLKVKGGPTPNGCIDQALPSRVVPRNPATKSPTMCNMVRTRSNLQIQHRKKLTDDGHKRGTVDQARSFEDFISCILSASSFIGGGLFHRNCSLIFRILVAMKL